MSSSSNSRSMFETVHSLKKQLINAVSNSNSQEIKNILLRLRKEVVPTEELIRTTKIGIPVGKQRQNPDSEISKLAKLIVNEWKHGVKREPGGSTNPTHAGSTSSGSLGTSRSPTGSGTHQKPLASTPTSAPSPPKPPPLSSSTSTSTSSLAPNVPSRTASAAVVVPKKTGQRSSKTEEGLNFELLADKVRDGSLRAVFDALISDSDAPADLVYERAKEIEAETNATHDSATYKHKMRSLIFNLRDKNNPGLREAVVSGELGAKKLCSMGPQDMASEERKAQDRKLAEQNLFKARGAGPQQAETDAFRCGRCGQRKCTYYQMQTRSADEPMTTFVTCVNCNNRWKFS